MGSLEILRRCMWNFFRLENEHLNNCGQYRATRDIRIKPLTDRGVADLQVSDLWIVIDIK